MKDYEEVIEKAIRAKDGKPVYNGSIEHATVLLSKMFNVAKKSIRILSGNLNREVYSKRGIPVRMDVFLSQGGEIRIIIEDHEGFPDHPVAALVEKYEKCEVKTLRQEAKSSIGYHMTTIDDFGYRFESDKDLPDAIAAFGDSALSNHLSDVFDDIWQNSCDEYSVNPLAA